MRERTGSGNEHRVSVRALVVWGTGALVCLIAVMDGATLGIVGLEAADRFHVDPAMLTAFCLVQIVVYMMM
ncbi:hypothetical protein [Streptomyces sp. NPDC090021]|uniref:hypothetical protein n=1 Tax=Streptomyces sp. NPDC090021 TaxID=3365919 RepID=UPI003813AEE6